MNYYCDGYTLDEEYTECPMEANSWGEFEGGQCDHCWSKQNNEECDNSYCEELINHPK